MTMRLEDYIRDIASDGSKDFNARVEEIMQLRDTLTPADDAERLHNDEVIYSNLLDMAEAYYSGENLHDGDETMLQLMTLLAETYVRERNYRNLGRIADAVIDILRDEVTPWEYIEEAVPRIIDAVEYSEYRHALYEILCLFMKAAIREGADMSEFESEAELLVRLRIVLADMQDSYLFSREIKEMLPAVLSAKKLVDIIYRPDPGHLRRDPVEYTRRWEKIYYDVEAELDRRFANQPRHMGFCFKYWSAKSSLLRDTYGIEWRTPSQMNPRVMFD